MALVTADRVKETTTVTTGTATLLGAVTGFQSFAVIGNANTTYYCIAGQTTSEWEVGIGTYTLSGTTLARTTILSNSSASQPTELTFSAGTKDVFVTYPSSKGVYLDASGNAIGLGTPAAFVATNVTGLPISTGVSGLGSNVATFLATPSSSNLAAALTDETGTGAAVFATSPTLVTPLLGTPTSGTVTNLTGTASININGTVGATTPAAGVFTTLKATTAGNDVAIIGTSTASLAFGTLQVWNSSQTNILAQKSVASNAAPWVFLFKSRATTPSASVIVQNGDGLGLLGFLGDDGVASIPAAYVGGFVDGVPSANVMPARLSFWTNGGSNDATERMRIASTGNTTFFPDGTNTVGTFSSTGLAVTGLSATSAITYGGVTLTNAVTGTGKMVLDTTPTIATPVLTNPTVTNYVETLQAVGTVGAASTLALTNGTVLTATLTALTPCTFTMPTATAGKSFILILTQAATGMTTATFTSVKFPGGTAPTITATASAVDVISFVANGTSWFGNYTQGFA